MSNIHDITMEQFMFRGPLAGKGYDWCWHSFTCNPDLGDPEPVFGQKGGGRRPSYLMVKCGAWGEKLHNRLWNSGTGCGSVRLYGRCACGFELIDEIIAENVGCEYGEYC